MQIITETNKTYAVIPKEQRIHTPGDLLDAIADARFLHQCAGLIVYRESLAEDFFDLKTGLAGEMLQKCSNYRMQLAIIGDFASAKSKSLRDFIYECNKGSLVFFQDSMESARKALAGKK